MKFSDCPIEQDIKTLYNIKRDIEKKIDNPPIKLDGFKKAALNNKALLLKINNLTYKLRQEINDKEMLLFSCIGALLGYIAFLQVLKEDQNKFLSH